MPTRSIQDNIALITSGLQNAITKGLDAASEEGVRHIRTTHEFQYYGDNGIKSHTTVIKESPTIRGVLTDRYYASWVNYGNAPLGTKIYPVNAKALRFVINGQVFFRKWVRASRPRPFFTNMVEMEKKFLPQALATAYTDFINTIL